MAGIQFNHESYNEYRDYLVRLGDDNHAARNRLIRNLRRATREELTDIEWRSVQLYYVDRIKMTDIADIMGVNVSTVSRNIKRGREKLRKCLKYGAKELLEE